MTTDRIDNRPRNGGSYTRAPGTETTAGLAIYDFGAACRHTGLRRLLVLKLDHLGDFLIALPALKKLRRLFAGDHITLVCGSWNQRMAREAEVADEILSYDFFPETSALWTGEPHQGIARFRAMCRGPFDIALDLRVDDDTRFLLEEVEASVKCGIGSRLRHPFLDVALPGQFERRETDQAIVLTPDRFDSRMSKRTPFFHETDFRGPNGHQIYGPYIALPPGRFRVFYGLRLSAPFRRLPGARVIVDVTRGNGTEPVAAQRVDWRRAARADAVELEFAAREPGDRYEFRVHTTGHPPAARMRFFGVRIEPLDRSIYSRFKPAELHIGEQLSLLVQLIGDRSRLLYPDLPPAPRAASADFARLTGLPAASPCIVVAPISNTEVRDWGLENYERLVALLLERTAGAIALVGAPAQRERLARIVAVNGADTRLVNLAGRSDWLETREIVRAADLVICNNSGVAHLAAAYGTPTLAIYSGSHQPQEWGPRGARARAVTAPVACSPCGYERLDQCPHDHLCMRLIAPEAIAAEAVRMLPHDPPVRP
ncbi:MAG: glycosyltransferase family 9 protein [Stellaceae bacterium]